jgi:uncharacterized membrane protein YsdA (DUF1294 family)
MEIDWHSVAAWYFAIINVVAVIIYGWDKLCAIRKWWRVSELTLFAYGSGGRKRRGACSITKLCT